MEVVGDYGSLQAVLVPAAVAAPGKGAQMPGLAANVGSGPRNFKAGVVPSEMGKGVRPPSAAQKRAEAESSPWLHNGGGAGKFTKPTTMTRHRRWLRNLQAANARKRAEAALEEAKKVEKSMDFKEKMETMRAIVLQNRQMFADAVDPATLWATQQQQRHEQDQKAQVPPASPAQQDEAPAAAAGEGPWGPEGAADERERLQAEMDSFLDGALGELMQSRHASASASGAGEAGRGAGASAPGGGKKRGGKNRPKWALTETAAEEEEDAEEESLLEFAEGLDYDGYVEGLDRATEAEAERLTEAEEAARERAAAEAAAAAAAAAAAGEEGGEGGGVMSESDWLRHISRELNRVNSAEAKGVDTVSVYSATSSTVFRLRQKKAEEEGEGKDWDTSSRAGESVAANDEIKSAKGEAEAILRLAPNLRQVHSQQSIMKLIEKQEAAKKAVERPRALAPLAEAEDEYDAPARVKKVDASNLPYLHMHPAV